MNDNWNGFILDGSEQKMASLKQRYWFGAYDLRAKAAFINKDNINALMEESGFNDVGLLSIDIDGNDYWILEIMDFSKLNPSIIITEYNALFGSKRAISIPYDKNFVRTKAHYSNLYFRASLKALVLLAEKRGYSLVGCCSVGTNAFFVRNDLLNEKIKSISIEQGFREDKCRQSRDKNYQLSYLRGDDRLNLIKGLKVINIENTFIFCVKS